MSLLIKALDKAEKAQVEKAAEQQKAEQQKAEQENLAHDGATSSREASRRRAGNIANAPAESLADAPFVLELTEPEQAQVQATQALAQSHYSDTHSSARANNVFASKAAPSAEIKPIVWIVLFGLLGLLSVAGYFYYQLNQMQAPAVMPVAPQANVVNTTQPAAVVNAQPAPVSPVVENVNNTTQDKVAELSSTVQPPPASTASQARLPAEIAVQTPEVTSTQARALNMVRNDANVKRSSASQLISVPTIASESASIKVSRSTAPPAVNPVLMSAYNAYLAGNDSEAQQLYKRVLQREAHNVDALLGMAAIAERQNRMDDALGWYQKVLEADPKNTIALNATVGSIHDPQTQVSQLKTLIAQHPNDANAHANLGAYFAEQSQWPEAQQSYFEAYRLNASAENALNLAVSLDQMGKPSLALPYYQQALALASAQSSTIDVAALQARMAAIQAQ